MFNVFSLGLGAVSNFYVIDATREYLSHGGGAEFLVISYLPNFLLEGGGLTTKAKSSCAIFCLIFLTIRHREIIAQLGYNSGHIIDPFSPFFYPDRSEYPALFLSNVAKN